MTRPARQAVLVAGIVLVAWTLRVLVGAIWQNHLPPSQQFGFGDSESYWQLARAISRGEAYAYPTSDFRVFRAPGYPLLLAPLWAWSATEPPALAARVATALVSAIGVGGVFWLGKELFDVRCAWLAAVAAAVDPGLIALGALVLSDGPFCAVLPFQFACFARAWRATSPLCWRGGLFITGLIAGCASLIRPSWLLFLPLALAAGVCFSHERKKHLAAAPWLLLGLCAAMLPWWVRNYIVTARFVPTTLQVGASLYDGLNPTATGASDMSFTLESTRPTGDAYSPERELALDRHWFRAAVAWAADHPRRALELAAIKVARVWNVWPNEPQFRSLPLRLAIFVSYVPVLVLAVIGLWRFRRRGWPLIVLYLPAVYFSLLHALFVSSLRYRYPALILLLVPAAAALVDIVEGWKRNARDR